LPAPDGPTRATVSPGRTVREKPFSAGRSGRPGIGEGDRRHRHLAARRARQGDGFFGRGDVGRGAHQLVDPLHGPRGLLDIAPAFAERADGPGDEDRQQDELKQGARRHGAPITSCAPSQSTRVTPPNMTTMTRAVIRARAFIRVRDTAKAASTAAPKRAMA
jgi:hypothetical protein